MNEEKYLDSNGVQYNIDRAKAEINKKQTIQLVSEMVLESEIYGSVPTALDALATRLTDTYRKNEIDLKVAGLLNPKRTVTFVNLPSLEDAQKGDMYNVSDEFVTTSDFVEGAGVIIPAGSNVYKTDSNKWDVLAGSPVTGVKGDKEANYRRGNVNITAENIGAFTKEQADVMEDEIATAQNKYQKREAEIKPSDDYTSKAFPTTIRSLATDGTDRIVAVCENSPIFLSTDGGENYQNVGATQGKNMNEIIHTQDGFVTVGADANIYYSANGSQPWTKATVNAYDGEYNVLSVAYDGDGNYIAVDAGDGQNGSYILTASDSPSEWTQSEYTLPYSQKIRYVNGHFVIVGYELIYVQKSDKSGWDTISGFSRLIGQDIAYGNGKYVIVGYGDGILGADKGAVYISNDLTTWEKVGDYDFPAYHLIFAGGIFFATGAEGKTWYSADGLTWKTGPDTGDNNNDNGLSLMDGKLVFSDGASVFMDSIVSSGYEITLYGYGNPSGNEYYTKEANIGKYYLDQNTGNVYLLSGILEWSLEDTLDESIDGIKGDIASLETEIQAISGQLSGKQNIILSNPMMLESHSYNKTETALSALATRLEATYTIAETDALLDEKADSSTTSLAKENQLTLGYSAKNLLKVTAMSSTINGISYTVNDDGTVFVAGGQTASGNSALYLSYLDADKIDGTIMSAFKNGSTSTYCMMLIWQDSNGSYLSEQDAYDTDIVLSKYSGATKGAAVIFIKSGYTIPSSGLTFYPMIRPSEIEDDTFVPYQKNVDYRLKEKDDYNLLEITAESKTINGISYTIDKVAGTVTANGTATADAYIIIATLAYEDAVGKIYSASPNGGSSSTYYGFIAFFASSWLANYSEYGTGLTVPVNESATTVRFEVMIRSGQTVSNLVFKPMITKAEYKGMPFKPYKTPILRGTIDSVDAYLNYDSDIVGVEVDMEAKTVTRIGGAVGKSAGTDFNSINAFGGRKRCNLADDGTVNAYYGGSGYAEDGSNGQVMVEQPKFYYKVVPLKVDKSSGKGWILRKARYYVSDKPREGFKIHPEFVRSGKIKEKVYHSAFEGCLYDTSASAYITNDAQVADFSADKLSSIANAKPISGLSQNLTRANTRKLAENRGLGWEQLTIQAASATQLLMLIEYATFNMQQALSAGNSAKDDDGSSNMAENTGATSSLGNASGEVTNPNGFKMFSYRGEENFYADIWKWLDGLNKLDQDVYIADHSFADDTKTGYTDAGITACSANGYIKAFCYSEDFDWLFIPAEIGGDSALPVGDYYWYAAGWRVAALGGDWDTGASDGAFYLILAAASSDRDRTIGGRLCYIPDTDESSDKAKTNEELTKIVDINTQVIDDDMSSVSSYVVASRSNVYYSYAAKTAYINLFCGAFPSGSNVQLMTLDEFPAQTTTFPVVYTSSTDPEFLKAGTGTITSNRIVRLNNPPEGATNCVINTTARILV